MTMFPHIPEVTEALGHEGLRTARRAGEAVVYAARLGGYSRRENEAQIESDAQYAIGLYTAALASLGLLNGQIESEAVESEMRRLLDKSPVGSRVVNSVGK